MKKVVNKIIVSLLGATLATGVGVALAHNSKADQASAYSTSSLPTTIDLNDTSAANIRSYYSSLNNLSQSERQGTNLLKNLKTILKNGQKYYAYDSSNAIWQIYEIADRDWVKSPASSTTYGTYNSSTNKITNYTYGTSASSSKNNPYIHALYINRDINNQTTAWDDHQQTQWGINREHVWPKAEGFETSGAGGARGDPMHLMAGNGYANNIHSNYYYGYVKTSSSYTDCGSKYSNQSGNLKGTSKTVDSGTVFEPQDCDKGDIARAIFYMVARYNYLSGSDSDGIDSNNPNLTLTQNISDWASNGYSSTTSETGKMGILTDLLNWHHQDPVDEYEIHRNNLLYTNYTNNRNPFIDFPEWVDFIWGTATYSGTTFKEYDSTPTGHATPSSDTINGYNGGSTDPVAVTGVSLEKNQTSITVGGSEVLSYTIAPNNATNKGVTWTSSNTNVATVSETGRVTAVAEGNSTITVRTSDGGYTATCAVTVTASGGGGGESGTAVYTVASTSSVTPSGDIPSGSSATFVNDSNTAGQLTFGKYLTLTLSGYDGLKITGLTLSAKSNASKGKAEMSFTTGANTIASIADANFNDATWHGSWSTSYVDVVFPSTDHNLTQQTIGNGNTVVLTVRNNGTTNTTNSVYIQSMSVSYETPAAEKTLDSISLATSDAPTSFTTGDPFSYEDLSVTANYSDGSSAIVTPTSVSTPDMSSAGVKTVTVSYTEGDITKTATYQITVSNPSKTLSSITLDTTNVQMVFDLGDTFNYDNLVVTAHYSDSSTDVVSPTSVTSPDMSSAGIKTITVTYQSQTASYQITVNQVLTNISLDTSSVKKTFNVGDTFTYSGLVVTAHYNDSSSDTIAAGYTVSSPDMSSAGTKEVTVTYNSKSATYNISVTSAGTTTANVVIADYASAHDWEDSTKYTSVSIDSNVTATVSAGSSNTGKYYNNGKDWRYYQTESGAITISCSSQYIIDTVTITYSGANSGVLKNGNVTVQSNVSQTVNASSVTYSVGNSGSATNGQARITAISVTYHENEVTPTSITASVSKTYFVGETITKSDITVEDNLGNTVTDFVFANYQFTYADAASGGALTNKNFTITYTTYSLSTTLTVQVQRKAYVAPTGSESDTLTYSMLGISGSSYQSWSGISDPNGSDAVYAGQSYANNNNYIQLRNQTSAGIVSTTSGGKITGVSISWNNSTTTNRYVTVYGKNTAYSSSADLYDESTRGTALGTIVKDTSTSLTITGNYEYVGILASAPVFIDSITFTYGTEETALNVANYVMYEDTNNQCSTKYSIAKGYFNNMSSAQKTEFMTSSDYVISTARERFEAWAKHHGEIIQSQGGDYVISRNVIPFGPMGDSDNTKTIAIVIISSVIGLGAIAGYFFTKKKKYQ